MLEGFRFPRNRPAAFGIPSGDIEPVERRQEILLILRDRQSRLLSQHEQRVKLWRKILSVFAYMSLQCLLKRKVDESDRRSVLVQRTVKGSVFLREFGEIIVTAARAVE